MAYKQLAETQDNICAGQAEEGDPAVIWTLSQALRTANKTPKMALQTVLVCGVSYMIRKCNLHTTKAMIWVCVFNICPTCADTAVS